MRLRQVVIASSHLEQVASAFERVLGIEECHRDPWIAAFGLENVMLLAGDTFLEILTPIKPDAAAGRYLERKGGDAGYMICIQVDDLPHTRATVERLGLRIVNETQRETLKGFHVHPRDIGGAIVALNIAIPPGSWEGAGDWDEWRQHERDDVTGKITGVVLGAPDPAALAQRWAEVLERPVEQDGETRVIRLDEGRCVFVAEADERRHGVIGFEIAAVDPAVVLANAARERLPIDGDGFLLAGVRVRPVGHAES